MDSAVSPSHVQPSDSFDCTVLYSHASAKLSIIFAFLILQFLARGATRFAAFATRLAAFESLR